MSSPEEGKPTPKEIQMNTPESQQQLPIVDITLETSLDDIPEGPPCIVCGYPMEKVFVDEHTCRGTSVIVRAKNVAGYRCTEGREGCDFESYGGEAILESLTKARAIMLARGDEVTVKALDAAIALEEKTIAETHLAMPYRYH